MTVHDPQDAGAQLLQLKQGIREIAHDISNPLGVLRMAAYYLQHGNPDKDKQAHYYTVITETVERVEAGLVRLRSLSEQAGAAPAEGGQSGKGT
jgi:nitrogen-specific signal transduction histidine kinase